MNFKQFLLISLATAISCGAHSAQQIQKPNGSVVITQSDHQPVPVAEFRQLTNQLFANPFAFEHDREKSSEMIKKMLTFTLLGAGLTETNPAHQNQIIKALQPIIATVNQKLPFWFSAECNGAHCALTRSINPSYRERFERSASIAVAFKSLCNKNVVNYVNFAPSGPSFTDLRLVASAVKCGAKHINIHMIDLKFKDYIAFMNVGSSKAKPTQRKREVPVGPGDEEESELKQADAIGKDTAKVEAHSSVVIDTIDQAFDTLTSAQSPFPELIKAGTLKSTLFFRMASEHTTLSQFLSWCKALYPDVTCTLYIHGSVHDYVNFTIKNPALSADVCIASDFQNDDTHQDSLCVQDFKRLIEYMFSRKPDAIGVFLGKIKYMVPNQKGNTAFALTDYCFIEHYLPLAAPKKAPKPEIITISDQMVMLRSKRFRTDHRMLSEMPASLRGQKLHGTLHKK